MGRDPDALHAHESSPTPAPPDPHTRSHTAAWLWALAGVVFCILVAVSALSLWATYRVSALQAEITARDKASAEVATLTQQLNDTLRIAETLAVAPTPSRPSDLSWPHIVDAVRCYDPSACTLLSISQEEEWIALGGKARSLQAVLDYATALETSGAFDSVLVESVVNTTGAPGPKVSPSPAATETPMPTATLTPTSTPTPSPMLYDTFEPDEIAPPSITYGEVQWRRFYPEQDIDRATFLGQPGRSYCIQAQSWSSSAGPYLTVVMGSAVYTSGTADTASSGWSPCQSAAGDTGSQPGASVLVHVPTGGSPQPMDIRITNRGTYDQDAWYTLSVVESALDAWEPDDLLPATISPGDAQNRTFAPDGDIDRATFRAQAGYSYDIRATALSTRADPVLSVFAGGAIYQNDSADSGALSARVTFVAATTGTVTVVVTNRGDFGPNVTYQLSLYESHGDAYEPDDYDPQYHALAFPHAHTFFPSGDVDRAEIAVVSGHSYVVETSQLSPGVDTAVSVLVDGTVYQNDDAYVGQPASRVSFRARSDGAALVTVTNRGQFGSHLTYTLTIRESAVAPSPTPSGDAYEPDDIIPRVIAVGAPVVHSFYPSGDVDRAVFLAKAGYTYRIETLNLSPGADTVLTAQIDQTTQTNDDRAPHDLSSTLMLTNATTADTPVYISVANKGDYAPHARYTLLVEHAGTGDAFEPDDQEPVPITVGTAQQRTFYPPGDVDRVTFVAKDGHRYRIYTEQVTAPVDTLLEVRMRDTHLVNDDQQQGILTSYLEIQNDGADTRADVIVYSNGVYDPDLAYLIRIDDLGAAGRDEYEPDETVPPSLWPGDVQRHTFYPEGDVDRVTLHVKGGRRYAVYTCGPLPTATLAPAGTATPTPPAADPCPPLPPGCDTVLYISGAVTGCDPGGCTNDDADPGSGRLNSRIEFAALADGDVIIEIRNQGAYGPQVEYLLLAEEVGLLSQLPVDSWPAAGALAMPFSDQRPCSLAVSAPITESDPEPLSGSANADVTFPVDFMLRARLRSTTP